MKDYTTYDDKALMRAISGSEGAEDAFTVLYNRYSLHFYKRVLRFVKDPLTAEELVQDVFTRIWATRQNLTKEIAAGAYLQTAVRNRVYDYLRSLMKDRRILEHMKTVSAGAINDGRELTAAELEKEQLELLRKAIATLPPQRRKVFELCRVEGKSYQEVAEELGLAMGTVKDHMAKGQKSVREYLTEQGALGIFVAFVLEVMAD